MMRHLPYALIGLSFTGLSFVTDSLPAAEGLPSPRRLSQIDEPRAGYFQASGVVRFQLVQGRINLDAPRHRKGSQTFQRERVFESIRVTAQRGVPSVHYVLEKPNRHITLHVQDGTDLLIESRLTSGNGSDSQQCVLHQPPSGMIRWTCNSVGQSHQWQAADLLQLRYHQPQLFDAHFAPLITRMLRGKALEQIAQRTRAHVFAELARPCPIQQRQIETLVHRLGSDRRQARVTAERELLRHGTVVVATLREQMESQSRDLHVEQKARIERILLRLRPAVGDRPSTLAKLMVNDPQYLASIQRELTAPQHALVASRLARFTGQEVQDTPVGNGRNRERLAQNASPEKI